MKLEASNVEEYLKAVPEERQPYFNKLRQTISDNIPKGFEETFQYGMIGFVVPHSSYPAGYHAKPIEPLPFVHIASQKNFIAFYHSGIYSNDELKDWFVTEYPNHCSRKLEMGKSCIRFKKIEEIPYDLIGILMQKISMDEWIKMYESKIKK